MHYSESYASVMVEFPKYKKYVSTCVDLPFKTLPEVVKVTLAFV